MESTIKKKKASKQCDESSSFYSVWKRKVWISSTKIVIGDNLSKLDLHQILLKQI